MNVTTKPVGSYQANCYFLQEGDHLALIDPGSDAKFIIQSVKDTNATLEYILLTHGHFDHTGAVEEVKAAFPEAKLYVHKEDSEGVGSQMISTAGLAEGFLSEGESFDLGGVAIKVITTPGHSKGSVCFLAEDSLFTGDTLFFGSMGRTDLSGGSYPEIMKSLRKISELEGDFTVYPGHDRSSTLNHERKLNPYVQEAMNG
ncbi:MAG: MBL fold metallo-hydrolase [Eubacteriales bacterium]